MVKNSEPKSGTALEVFLTFLKLGLTSFGGPIAHIGYFRTDMVERRRWVSAEQFAQLLAICQFMPGPASSQLGFSLGLLRAGSLGALAAFVAFTKAAPIEAAPIVTPSREIVFSRLLNVALALSTAVISI